MTNVVVRSIDAGVLLSACGSDAEILAKIVAALAAQLPASLGSLRSHAARGDAAAVHASAHKLHGMIATASSIAGSVAAELELAASGGDLTHASAWIDRLDELINEVLAELATVSVYTLQCAVASSD